MPAQIATASFAPIRAALLHSRQRMTVGEAERIAFECYGIKASARELTGEASENFHLASAAGEFILKIAGPADDPAVVDLANAALRHIERTDAGLPCPRVRRDVEGRSITTVLDSAGRRRLATLLTWLPGTMLREVPQSAVLRAACGRTAALLARALRDFRHPAAARPMAWDLCQLTSLRPMLDDLSNHRDAAFIAGFLDRYESVTTPAFATLRRQVLHNDMNLRNVLVDPSDPTRVAGVIDFGDVVETALIADVAIVATAPLLLGSRQPVADINDTVAAYRAVVPLRDQELAILNWLIAGRLVSALLIPAWHRSQNPASKHYPPRSDAVIDERVALVEALTRMRLH